MAHSELRGRANQVDFSENASLGLALTDEFDRDRSTEERGERSLQCARCCQQHALEWRETTKHLENDVAIDDLGHRLPHSWCFWDAQEEASNKVDGGHAPRSRAA